MPTPALSVVVGSVDSARSIERCLSALATTCAGLDAEIIVVDASADGGADRARRAMPDARVISRPVGTLTPVLWSAGLSESHGNVVAFLTGHCIVEASWARAMLAALETGAAGAGGPFTVATGTSLVDWAVFYLRYSAFLSRPTGRDFEIAGDNAAYRRDALDRHVASFSAGFWELDFHRRLRTDGQTLAWAPDAIAAFGPSFPLAHIAAHRFAHARRFAAERVVRGEREGWKILLAAPLVPFLMLARIARRVLSHSAHRTRFILSSPVIFVLAACWAAGEAVGAFSLSDASLARTTGSAP